jgi:hypothetical protein
MQYWCAPRVIITDLLVITCRYFVKNNVAAYPCNYDRLLQMDTSDLLEGWADWEIRIPEEENAEM